MPDREKVIKALELCASDCSIERCVTDNCPYLGCTPDNYCFGNMAKDALELLKAQEPVKPKKVNRYFDVDDEGKPYIPETYDCGVCGNELPESLWKANYCPNCGRPVKWE